MENYQFIGRNIEVTEAMRNYAYEKLERLARFSDQVTHTKVVMSYKHGENSGEPAKVEVQLNIPSGMVRAEERDIDTYVAIDKVMDKLERQIKRHKGRLIAKRHRNNEVVPSAMLEQFPDYQEDRAPEIVRVKRHVLRPMSPEDAAMAMESLGHDFYMFHNVDTEKVSVIYLRKDGDYGMLEPAN